MRPNQILKFCEIYKNQQKPKTMNYIKQNDVPINYNANLAAHLKISMLKINIIRINKRGNIESFYNNLNREINWRADFIKYFNYRKKCNCENTYFEAFGAEICRDCGREF